MISNFYASTVKFVYYIFRLNPFVSITASSSPSVTSVVFLAVLFFPPDEAWPHYDLRPRQSRFSFLHFLLIAAHYKGYCVRLLGSVISLSYRHSDWKSVQWKSVWGAACRTAFIRDATMITTANGGSREILIISTQYHTQNYYYYALLDTEYSRLYSLKTRCLVFNARQYFIQSDVWNIFFA